MAKMKAVQVPKAGADFEIVEREIPQPGAGQVRIRVQACGICHSDVITKRRPLPRHYVPARPRTRSSWRDRRTGRGREGMAGRPAGWSWLARWARRHLSCVPTRGFRELREWEGLWDQLRRRLSGIHGHAGGSVSPDAGIARGGGGRAADVCRRYHV